MTVPLRRSLTVAALVAVPVLAGCGQPAPAASAAPAAASTSATVTADEQPSACRPANHRGVITPADPSAGHRHYRVTLTAAPGFAPCTLAGAPTQVMFYTAGGGPVGVEVTAAPEQGRPVEFGPGQDVAFDISVPNGPAGASAASVTFTLHAPDGEIPGEQEASRSLAVDAGTQVGPAQAA